MAILNQASVFMSSTEALHLFGELPQVLQAYICSRAGEHGIPPHELLMKLHECNRANPVEIYKYIRGKHISHKVAVSEGGSSSDIGNWIYEDGSVNMSRQEDPMQLREYLDAQLDNFVDAKLIDFGTPEPGQRGYEEAFSKAFGEPPEKLVNMDDFIDTLSGEGVGVSKIVEGQVIHIGAMDATRELWQGLEQPLAEIGIPATYVLMRGFGGVLPFLRSIDWTKFKNDGQYRQKTLVRSLKVFRENGWKEPAKAIVIGFLIASFPPLGFFVAAVGLTGVAALGTRWLASKVLRFSGPVARAFALISDALAKAHAFLKQALLRFEKVVEVTLDVAAKTTKKILKASGAFAESVHSVAKEVVKSVVARTSKGIKSLAKSSGCLVRKVSNWICSWFGSPAYA